MPGAEKILEEGCRGPGEFEVVILEELLIG